MNRYDHSPIETPLRKNPKILTDGCVTTVSE